MEIMYSDRKIEKFIRESKVLPDNWYSNLYKNEKLDVKGKKGNFLDTTSLSDKAPSTH